MPEEDNSWIVSMPTPSYLKIKPTKSGIYNLNKNHNKLRLQEKKNTTLTLENHLLNFLQLITIILFLKKSSLSCLHCRHGFTNENYLKM